MKIVKGQMLVKFLLALIFLNIIPGFFSDVFSEGINVTYPDDYIRFKPGDTIKLRWETDATQPYVSIGLFDVADSASRIVTNVADNNGSYDWIIPDSTPNSSYILDVMITTELKGQSSVFKILTPPKIKTMEGKNLKAKLVSKNDKSQTSQNSKSDGIDFDFQPKPTSMEDPSMHQVQLRIPEVNFMDGNFEKAMRGQIGKKAPVTVFSIDVEKLTELKIPKEQISNISGIEYCSGLERLDLSNNQIMGINRLSVLDNLKYINLDSNQVTDITELLNNPGLDKGDTLSIRGNPLSCDQQAEAISTLRSRGVTVLTDCP